MSLENQIEAILPSLFAIVDDERQSALAQAAVTCLTELINIRAAQTELETQPI